MKKTLKFCIYVVVFLLGAFSVVIYNFFNTLFVFHDNVIYRDIESGIKISKIENAPSKVIEISKDDYLLYQILFDKFENRLERSVFYDAQERVLAVYRITDNFFELWTDDEIPFFQMKYSQEQNRWQNGVYFKATDKTLEKFIGVSNEDYNIDGQIDLVEYYDKTGEYEGPTIFFNYKWYPVSSFTSEDYKSVEVWTDIKNKEKVELIFDNKEGWIPKPVTN